MAHAIEPNGSVPRKKSPEMELPDWLLARKGIDLIINDGLPEAQKLFSKYPENVVIYAGYAFALLMDALMSFEEPKLTAAVTVLKEVEKRCVTENGWIKSVTTRVFGATAPKPIKSYSEELETQIILADSQVCLAIITFLQQDISGYFKGVWVLRKAWKVYQKVYDEILTLYKENIGELQLPDPGQSAVLLVPDENIPASTKREKEWDVPEVSSNGYTQNSSIPHSKSSNLQLLNKSEPLSPSNSCKNSHTLINDLATMFHLKKSVSINTALGSRVKDSFLGTRQNSIGKSLTFYNISSSIFPTPDITQRPLQRHEIIRLMGAVSFGYGLFQLGVSLLPPSLIKLINIFGFSTNRENGLSCLMYARLGCDMRAPLASLSLLWYHTIVRPFYAIDGPNVQAGVEAAFMLLRDCEQEYGKSSFFLFFKGRAYRLSSNIKNALESFQLAASKAAQREMKTLCMHEIGWCHVIELEYSPSKDSFNYLKTTSRWSKAFYAYLAVICAGACGDIVNSISIVEFKEMTADIPKGMQLDVFLVRRLQFCPSDESTIKSKTTTFWKLFVFELLYLWNALPSCSNANVQLIIKECQKVIAPEEEPMTGLSKLILGCSYCVQKQYNDGIVNLRECLRLRKNIPGTSIDAHISAFCQYELAALLVKDPDTKAEGIALLQQMNQYKNYDFEQKLNVRVHSLLK